MIRSLILTAGAAVIGMAMPAIAQQASLPQTDMTAVTCGDLIGMSNGMALATISWYDGYLSNEHGLTATELSSMEAATQVMRELCRSQPTQRLYELMSQMAAQAVR